MARGRSFLQGSEVISVLQSNHTCNPTLCPPTVNCDTHTSLPSPLVSRCVQPRRSLTVRRAALGEAKACCGI